MGMACFVQPGDELMWVERCNADDSVLLASSDGMAIRFPTNQVSRHLLLITPKWQKRELLYMCTGINHNLACHCSTH